MQIIASIFMAVIAGFAVLALVGDNDSAMQLTSPAFEHNTTIPSLYTCDEERTKNPELHIEGAPEGTQTFVLLMDDPDIPQVFKDQRGIEDFDHWALFNIPSDTTVIREGESVGVVGVNGREENGYTGPCPPPEHEPTEHRYIFTLYALDTELSLSEGATHEEIRTAMEGHILEEAQLIGLYDRAE